MSAGCVSFIIAVYNGEKYILEAVESCLNQTHPDVEVVVTDDGSTDRTLLMLKNSFGSNERVKILFFDKNRGKVAAYNNSFANSTGDFVAIMGGDDVCLKERAALSLEALTRHGAEMVCGDCFKMIGDRPTQICLASQWFGIQGERQIDFTTLVRRHVVFGGTLLGTREAFRAIFPIPDSFRKEDSWVALAAAHRRPITYIDVSLIQYRFHDANSSWLNAMHDFQSWVDIMVREIPFFHHAAKVFQMTPEEKNIWAIRTRIMELLRERKLSHRLALARGDLGIVLLDWNVPAASKLRFLVALASPRLAYRISRHFTRRAREG